MANVFAGTSGWAYSTWKPRFYPANLGSPKFLSYYASRLNSVEVNYTFRRLPSEELLTNWIAATPPDFKFGIKAHQMITHMKRLRGAMDFTLDFISSLQPLEKARKLGPILFQLPPNFKCDLQRFKEFLAGLPRELRIAFEFRHASWFADDVFDALRKVNAALCQAESETLQTPDVHTADFSYLRLRKDKYSTSARKKLALKVKRCAQRDDIFVYFKHEETPEGALYAEDLLAASKTT